MLLPAGKQFSELTLGPCGRINSPRGQGSVEGKRLALGINIKMEPRLVPLIAAALFLVSCQHDLQRADESQIAGIYYLVKVAGTAIPSTVSHDGAPLKVLSGTFIIGADGTCFSRTRFVAPDGNEITREVNADYRIQDSRLIMQWEGAGVTEGTVQGDVFVMDNHGTIFEYSRRP